MRITTMKVVCASFLLSLLVAAGVTAYTASRRPQEPRKVHVPKLFLSEVKKLKVESHWIENEGTPEANLVVVIRNKSALTVTRLSITISDLTISRDGGFGLEEPEAVIGPYATTQISVPLTSLIDDTPFFISAAVYTNGTEEGRKEQLKWAHEAREERRAEREAKKGGPEQ